MVETTDGLGERQIDVLLMPAGHEASDTFIPVECKIEAQRVAVHRIDDIARLYGLSAVTASNASAMHTILASLGISGPGILSDSLGRPSGRYDEMGLHDHLDNLSWSKVEYVTYFREPISPICHSDAQRECFGVRANPRACGEARYSRCRARLYRPRHWATLFLGCIPAERHQRRGDGRWHERLGYSRHRLLLC